MTPTRTVAQPTLAERTRSIVTPLNLHFAGVGILALVCLYLLIHMAFAWQSASSQDAAAVARQTALMQTAEHAARPLRGLDGKLAAATDSADDFSGHRLPFAYSQVVAELGSLAKKQGITLTRVQYAQSPILAGAAGAVTEVRMDASLSGDYRPLVLFMNSVERDRMFFYISGITLTGQQTGTVNLRIKLTTYLRSPLGNEGTARQTSSEDYQTAAPGTASSEGPR